ncbi:MAG: DUF6754 domain-containing protein, partial [Candidatus Bathyarchaeia archaeon]
TNNVHQMPFLVATCDYMLLAEEMFAAGAEIRGDSDVLGSLKGEDYIKLIIVILLIIGFMLGLGNITTLQDILGV